ncbi:MAG: hypothetical protein Q9170_002546 [Blastenia crenularia]
MGNTQSTGDGPGNGIDSHTSEDEIKKAYRRKALELHPDRNHGNVEESTRLFAEIQSAYEVLSDPQERAWYDSHRNVILRGDEEAQGHHYDHNVRVTTAEEITKMLPKLNVCRDFSDSRTSFFSVLRDYFDTLAREEELACERQNIDPIAYPGFGSVHDHYDPAIRSFYSVWNNFATSKAFSWADTYRYSEAPDRRVRRLMEKENRRLREEAIREFNDAVRSLVAFVKKRDPRFKPSVQSEADRQKAFRDAAAAQAARSRAANQAKVGESVPLPQWAQPQDPGPSEDSDSVEEEPQKMYECVVCNKIFKSEKQFQSHEKSKKHVKAAQKMRKEMQLDDENLHLAIPTQDEPCSVSGSDLSNADFQPVILDPHAVDQGVAGLSVDVGGHLSTTDRAHGDEHGMGSVDTAATSTSDDGYADREDIEKRITGLQHDVSEHDQVLNENNISSEAAEQCTTNQTKDPLPPPQMGKAKAKRARKAAQGSSANASASVETQVSKVTCPRNRNLPYSQIKLFKCSLCQAGFPSKTKLFNHISNLGHARPTAKEFKGRKG